MSVVLREAWDWLKAWGRVLVLIGELLNPVFAVIGRITSLVCLVLVAGELWGLWDVL